MSVGEIEMEEFENLFGNLAVKKGFITSEEFVQALENRLMMRSNRGN